MNIYRLQEFQPWVGTMMALDCLIWMTPPAMAHPAIQGGIQELTPLVQNNSNHSMITHPQNSQQLTSQPWLFPREIAADKVRAKRGVEENNNRNPDKICRASAIMEEIPNVGW